MPTSHRQIPEGIVSASKSIPGEVARRIRLVVLDVDGVLTDGGVYQGQTASGESVELKRFDIQDGLGAKLLNEQEGLRVVWVSGRVSSATSVRAEELGIECHQDPGARKMAVIQKILDRYGITWGETAMLADDIPDLAVFTRMGLRAAVANAQPEIMEEAHWIASHRGGHGAVREFCRALMVARGEWDGLVERYVERTSEMIESPGGVTSGGGGSTS